MLRYAITDRLRLAIDEPARQSALLAQASRLATEGIDFLQLREKDLTAAALADLTRKLLATLRTHSADLTRPAPRLLINSRADIAIATRADGVHLTSAPGSLTPAQVRALYTAAALPEPIVSLSCHTLAEVARAASSAPDERATYILFGPVFEKVVANAAVANDEIEVVLEDRISERSAGDKNISAGVGLDLLRAACRTASPVPVLALGGITSTNTPACQAAGAAGIAAIRLFLE